MNSYVLFKGAKRLAVKEEDMTVAKIGRIFQVLRICSLENSRPAITTRLLVIGSVTPISKKYHYPHHHDFLSYGSYNYVILCVTWASDDTFLFNLS